MRVRFALEPHRAFPLIRWSTRSDKKKATADVAPALPCRSFPLLCSTWQQPPWGWKGEEDPISIAIPPKAHSLPQANGDATVERAAQCSRPR